MDSAPRPAANASDSADAEHLAKILKFHFVDILNCRAGIVFRDAARREFARLFEYGFTAAIVLDTRHCRIVRHRQCAADDAVAVKAVVIVDLLETFDDLATAEQR